MHIAENKLCNSNLITRITNNFQNSINVKIAAASSLKEDIANASIAIFQAIINGNKLLCCGNGGSAADSQHFVAELINRFEIERRPLAALSLTTDTSVLTSIGNDYSYAEIFSKQISALGKPKDILVAISTSGNSSNIIKALEIAKQKQITVIALTGNDGGKIAQLLEQQDIEIRVPSNSTARIQETHILTIHCICDAIDWQYQQLQGDQK